MNAWRNTARALFAPLIACGTGTVPSRSPSTDFSPAGTTRLRPRRSTPRSLGSEPRPPAAPALGVALIGPAGDELGSSTRWTLAGGGTELRLEVRTRFSGAEAEVPCRLLAGDGAVESLRLGTPVWTTANDVYLTRGASCIRVSVTRSGRADPAGAAAVAGVLARAD